MRHKSDHEPLQPAGDQGQPQDRLRSGLSQLPSSSENIPELLHVLRTQQVQLEMQNEELRQSQDTLAEACDHYTQMYDFTPSGYVTLTPEAMIKEANLRFCTMVGVIGNSSWIGLCLISSLLRNWSGCASIVPMFLMAERHKPANSVFCQGPVSH